VERKTSNELDSREVNDVLSGAEDYLGVGDVDDSSIGDSDPLDISGEVLGDVLDGPAVGRLDMDDPAAVSFGELAYHGAKVFGRSDLIFTAELELVVVEGLNERLEESTFEHCTDNEIREEVIIREVNPLFLVEGQTAGGDEKVGMWMVGEVRGPGMQDSGDTELGVEALSGEVLQNGGCSADQQAINQILVVICNGSQLGWESEDDLEVRNRQHQSSAFFEPLGGGLALALGTVAVSTRVECQSLPTTVVADALMCSHFFCCAGNEFLKHAYAHRVEPVSSHIGVHVAT